MRLNSVREEFLKEVGVLALEERSDGAADVLTATENCNGVAAAKRVSSAIGRRQGDTNRATCSEVIGKDEVSKNVERIEFFLSLVN